MTTDPIVQKASGDIGGFILANYRNKDGQLHAANAVSAMGALAGIFTQIQGRSLLRSGAMKQSETTLVEVVSNVGEKFYFGDAINACLLDGTREAPSFWNVAAGAARDPSVGEKIDVMAIAKQAVADVGSAKFGTPAIGERYQLSEHPVEAVRKHGQVLLRRFLEIDLHPSKLALAFGTAAQGLAAFAAGEVADVPVNMAIPRVDIVRLYMESAIPVSKLDIARVGMVVAVH